MKRICLIAVVMSLFLFVRLENSQANMILDTGVPEPSTSTTTLSGGPPIYPMAPRNFIAIKFDLTQTYRLESIQGFLSQVFPGEISVVLYGGDSYDENNNEIPNVNKELFVGTFFVAHNNHNSWEGLSEPNWEGLSDLDCILSPGSYWAAFEVRKPGFLGGMPQGGIVSINYKYAFLNDNYPSLGEYIGGWYKNDGNGFHGWRIQGTPVPVPGAIWLFGSGFAALAGAKIRRKKK